MAKKLMEALAAHHVGDTENPEWNARDFKRAKPASAVLPELVQEAKRQRGRPRLENPKVQVTLRLDQEIVDAFKAKGDGWQRRINDTLAKSVQVKPPGRAHVVVAEPYEIAHLGKRHGVETMKPSHKAKARGK